MPEDSKNKHNEAYPYRWASATDKGKVREENEDAFVVEHELPIFIVSDGMGGHRGGALASKIVIDDLPVMIETRLDKMRVGTTRTIRSLLRKTIAEQSKQVQLEGTSESGFKDMGATLVLVLLRKDRCFVANIGDSRVYLLRKKRFSQLTRDHSVVSELIRKGKIEPEQAENHEAQGVVTQYIGMEEKAKSHVRTFVLKKQDRLLLCTDGLSGMLDDKDIAKILKKETDPEAACKKLVNAANAAGGHDNITVVIVDWLGVKQQTTIG